MGANLLYMAAFKSWIKAARPRTLPLAVSGILTGCGLAWFYGAINTWVSLLAIVTAIFIQIFSNLANDYGDSQKGTDNEHRVGPTRTIQGGEITSGEMKKGMLTIATICIICGLALLYTATWNLYRPAFFLFIGFGMLSLLAAWFYTAGKRSYGYIGLGDLAVFLFFGLLPVAGAFYLNSSFITEEIFLPAISIGCFSVGVLNLNNMRDIENDRKSGKITIPVRLNRSKSRIYHCLLIMIGWVAALTFIMITHKSAWQWLCVLSMPLFINDLLKIVRIKEDRKLDPFLKRLSLSTLAFTLLFCTGLILNS